MVIIFPQKISVGKNVSESPSPSPTERLFFFFRAGAVLSETFCRFAPPPSPPQANTLAPLLYEIHILRVLRIHTLTFRHRNTSILFMTLYGKKAIYIVSVFTSSLSAQARSNVCTQYNFRSSIHHQCE